MNTVRALVVCPTEYGGHIEHAADLSLALCRRSGNEGVLLVSRPGARNYLGDLGDPSLQVLEDLPARRVAMTGIAARVKPVLQVIDLVREHLALRRLVRQLGSTATVIFETPKYPIPFLVTGRQAESVLFMHNASPHDTSAGLRQKVLRWLERRCINGVDRAVTHGAPQARLIAGYTRTPVEAVPLPTTTALGQVSSRSPRRPDIVPDEPYALCIGELRPNKGIEQAIVAAAEGGLPLLVAGKSVDPALSSTLSELADTARSVVVHDEFLSKGDFDALIQHAALVVLPYTHFDAQSGILSKAVGAEVDVLAADLASLRDQAADYPLIRYTEVDDPQRFAADFGAAFIAAVSSGRRPGPVGATSTSGTNTQDPGTGGVPTPPLAPGLGCTDWDAVAAAVIGVSAGVPAR